MRNRYTALCAVILLAACFDTGPKTFANLSELKTFQEKEGYVEISHFGNAWPAKMKREKVYHDRVAVILANQDMHDFDQFDGYKLKVVTLQGAKNAEVVVVFRSKEKE